MTKLIEILENFLYKVFMNLNIYIQNIDFENASSTINID